MVNPTEVSDPTSLERDGLSFLMLCAFVNITPEQGRALKEHDPFWKIFANESNRDAWRRVAEAAKTYLKEKWHG